MDEIVAKQKARAIVDVGPEGAVFTGEVVDNMASLIKTILFGDDDDNPYFRPNLVNYPWHPAPVTTYHIYASGKGQIFLHNLINRIPLDRNLVIVIVAGDDCLALVRLEGVDMWFESDFSKYDQSQMYFSERYKTHDGQLKLGSLNRALNLLILCGVDGHIIDALKRMIVSAPSVVSENSGKIRFHYDFPMLPTGISVTTLFNCLTTLNIWHNVLVHTKTLSYDSMMEQFKNYGFTVKLKTSPTILGCTFLKQCVCSFKQGLVFVPLLGRICKAGIYKGANLEFIYGKTADYRTHIKQFMSDVCNGLMYDVPSPFSQALVSKFVLGPLSEAYKNRVVSYTYMQNDVEFQKPAIDDIDFTPLYTRYNLDDSEMSLLVDWIAAHSECSVPDEISSITARFVRADYM